MPPIHGRPKEQISYKCPHDLLLKINTMIENEEYSSRNDIITAALRNFFNNSNHDLKHQISDWLSSDEGEELMERLIMRILDKRA
jgi:metal-responsive CopG/Arc/MetJ family transcriptional regulator